MPKINTDPLLANMNPRKFIKELQLSRQLGTIQKTCTHNAENSGDSSCDSDENESDEDGMNIIYGDKLFLFHTILK